MKIRLLIKGDAIQIGECEFYNPCKTIDVDVPDDAIDIDHEHIIGAEILNDIAEKLGIEPKEGVC